MKIGNSHSLTEEKCVENITLQWLEIAKISIFYTSNNNEHQDLNFSILSPAREEKSLHKAKYLLRLRKNNNRPTLYHAFFSFFNLLFTRRGEGEETQNTRRERSPQFLNFGYASHKTTIPSKKWRRKKNERSKNNAEPNLCLNPTKCPSQKSLGTMTKRWADFFFHNFQAYKKLNTNKQGKL